MQPPPVIDYESGNATRRRRGPRVIGIFAIATLGTCFLPIWLNFADAFLVPAYIGTVIMAVGVLPLLHSKRWGMVCVLLGSVLLLIDLAFIVAMLVDAIKTRPTLIHELDASDVLLLLATAFDTCTVVLLLRALTRRV